jgi:hypothetical protein
MPTTPTTPSSLSLESLYRPLWLTYGLVPLLAGLDKFFNLLTDWPKYLAPWLAHLLPFSVPTFFHLIGVIEIAVGVLVLTRWTRLGAWIATAWLALIALNLATMGLFDIAVRDLAMAVGASTLARLAQLLALRQAAPAALREPGLRESRV